MENKLEQLLNNLIEKGWRPFGFIVSNARTSVYTSRYYFFENCADGKTLRQITSKESQLWQFCVENGMVKHEVYEDIQSWEHTTADHSDFWYTSGDNYEFYVIESSLKDESELEDFLLQNIKVEGLSEK